MRKGKLVLMIIGVTLALTLAAGQVLAASVTARVVHGSGTGIQAKLEPAEFTVPAGQKAVNLRYSFADSKSGSQSTTLGKNIYCITTGKYMVDAAGKPLPELAAGQYRFFVGGGVGASGSLAYDLVPAK
jgi:hypothetical protein